MGHGVFDMQAIMNSKKSDEFCLLQSFIIGPNSDYDYHLLSLIR